MEIIIPRDKLLHRIIRIIRNTPEVMRIRLDDRGIMMADDRWVSYGRRDRGLLNEKFGEGSPIYERLWVFLRILSNNGFITFAVQNCVIYPTGLIISENELYSMFQFYIYGILKAGQFFKAKENSGLYSFPSCIIYIVRNCAKNENHWVNE